MSQFLMPNRRQFLRQSAGLAGLAAATVQALHQKLAAKDAELMALAERLSALEQQLARKNGGAR